MDSAYAVDNLAESAGYAAEYSYASAPTAPSAGRCRMGFALFILVNATLFIRPAEIVPGWENLPIYQILILACLAFSLPVVLPQLTWSSLRRNPITLCVLGVLVAIILSQVSRGDLYSARAGATEFVKIVVYYLLLVGLIDSPTRLRRFLLITAGFVLVVAILCILNHHGVIDIPALSELQEFFGEDDEGDRGTVLRLRAMGIFNDPNDFCLILNAAVFICLHWLIERRGWLWKLACMLPLVPLVYAITLTKSRGGLLSLVVGMLVLCFTRISWKRAVLLALLCAPGILIIGGRQTNFDLNNNDDTAQGRIHLWRDSLVEFHGRPFFGIGYGQLPEEIGLVAHNSYVHSFAELGFFGGTLFIGAFYFAVDGIRRLNQKRAPLLSAELSSLRLCLLPVLAAYMMGVYSLSRCYANTTYMIFGVAAAFLAIAVASGFQSDFVDGRLVRRLVVASLGCVLYFEVFVRVFAH